LDPDDTYRRLKILYNGIADEKERMEFGPERATAQAAKSAKIKERR
jgi:hypothetical protein